MTRCPSLSRHRCVTMYVGSVYGNCLIIEFRFRLVNNVLRTCYSGLVVTWLITHYSLSWHSNWLRLICLTFVLVWGVNNLSRIFLLFCLYINFIDIFRSIFRFQCCHCSVLVRAVWFMRISLINVLLLNRWVLIRLLGMDYVLLTLRILIIAIRCFERIIVVDLLRLHMILRMIAKKVILLRNILHVMIWLSKWNVLLRYGV